ncbi:MAG: family 20 glycosylhydrolase [candidate division KSB1 bacterium]|nr:family 20 glycosylhydrolase [candidate division KSB1 bacterium]MDZ7368661.1 family 20 glycosylhydrolase [candidate division KSB1 bacterium]MDZ7406476.1 family 20 glycosylhydrolase [candidate division KSB1 bacterium]
MDRIAFDTILTSLALTASFLFADDKTIKLNLMPVPAQIELQNGEFRLDSTFTIAVTGQPDQRLYHGATRMLRRLSGRTGLFFSQDYIAASSTAATAKLAIDCKRAGKVKLGENESYQLRIAAEKITLEAETDLGVLRGLETLLQLLLADEQGYYFPQVIITDAPRFPWRGLLIDVCRHFLPMEVIKRNLDAMAAVKLNVLHLHLTEDQGFRIESKTYPKLHQMGSDGFFFTHEQMREIIAYAEARGIRVVPEFDMPGHVTSWLAGHPELAALPGPYRIERKYGIMDPALDPTKEYTYKFLDAFLSEMAKLFPDEYLHIGGDENNGKHWDQSPTIAKFKAANGIKDNHDLQTYFNKRLLQILTRHGKKMVGWDEILQPGMPTNIVIQSWRGQEALVQSAQQGYTGILSNGYYIDLVQPTDFHYLNDPIPENSPLSDEQKKKILGGEATMWSELVTPENVDSRIWPRTAAIAERFWSPQRVKDVNDMYRRLNIVSLQLEELGLMHEKNYDMMLRRLANQDEIAPLKALVDVIEPIKIYTRHQYRTYTSYAPFSRVVDAARPDSKTARDFRQLVEKFLSNKSNVELKNELTMWLKKWESNHAQLTAMMQKSPVLREIAAQSENLSKTSAIGLQALEALASGKSLGASWLAANLAYLEKAKGAHAETELMIVSGVEKLAQAAR